jgi:hypothetical protein
MCPLPYRNLGVLFIEEIRAFLFNIILGKQIEIINY